MRKTKIALIAAAAVLVSCSKSGADIYRGYYSFKTGGFLEITGKVYDIARDTIKIDTTVVKRTIAGRTFNDTTFKYTVIKDTLGSRDTVFNRYLSAESGQMHILGAGGNSVKVTMNVTGGNPAVFDGTAGDASISLLPVVRQVGILPGNDDEEDKSTYFLMTVSGSGKKYENMVLFDLDYSGKYDYADMCGEVTSSSVNCIATKNE
ncbi:MAG: hypothetical protein MJY48_00505 [Bacteroidales bacterium]|nr:hypothetical protein [Bacteroidales bacterium]